MNTPVNFPIDKLLKEKGFTFRQREIYYNAVSGFTKYEDIAPTIADVVMWIYEKYGIWISCEPYDVGRFKYIIINELNLSGKEITGFNSPTEAYEAAIEYTLNNLI